LYAAELEATVEHRTRELAQRNQAMRLVLDSVQEGLVGIDLEGWMAPERSATADRWFGLVSGRLTFSEHVHGHDPSFASSLQMGLEQLREDILPFELCRTQLPKRLEVRDQTLAVAYETMLANGKCSGFLLVISDITAQLERERLEAEQLDLVRVLESIGRDRIGFLSFLEEANQLVEELTSSASVPLATALRLVHTLKGNAAQFGISTVARVCHEIEHQVCEQGELSARERELLATTWRSVRERIRSLIGDRSQSHMEIERADYRSVVRFVGHRPDYDDILEALLAWELDPVQARFERLGDYARGLAERLEKPGIEVVCDAHSLRSDNSKWGAFWAACVHLVRNAVDHGIEQPLARTAAGKTGSGRLVLDARHVADEIIIQVSDDGRGVSWDRLATKEAERGLPFDSPEQRLDVLFHDGISSCDMVTETSGRGIGMAAVREEVLRHGGTIGLTSEPGRGTMIEMRFPSDTMLDFKQLRAMAVERASLRPTTKAGYA
jgi:two-component system chemotaxis sensor kinase CheA